METSLSEEKNPAPDPLEHLVRQIVEGTPQLESLSMDDLALVAKAVVVDGLKDELKRRLDLARIDLAAKRQLFLARYRSLQTRRSYQTALAALEEWTTRAGVNPLDLKPRHADAYIASLSGSPSSIRLKVAAASSFFTFLDRETEGRIRNPFLGTKLRPSRSSAPPMVPSLLDVETVMTATSGDLKAAIVAVLEHGFRVGALPTLQIWGTRYQGISKGSHISGIISERTKIAVKEAGLDPRTPWKATSSDSLRNRFRFLCSRLFSQHKIAAIYSIHDLRHFFAIQRYLADKDVYSLKLLLGHASLQVTENYLRGLHSYLSS